MNLVVERRRLSTRPCLSTAVVAAAVTYPTRAPCSLEVSCD